MLEAVVRLLRLFRDKGSAFRSLSIVLASYSLYQSALDLQPASTLSLRTCAPTHVDLPSLLNMAALSAAEEMDKLQLSEEDTEDLWDSPSKRRTKTPRQKAPRDHDASPDPAQSRSGETLFDQEETREAALRNELQSVRNINQVIEGLLESLDRAKGNMTVCQLYTM